VTKTTETESWIKLYDGPNGEVWILRKCIKELNKLKQNRLRATLEANMSKRFCMLEDLSDLTKSQFALNEDRFSYNGKEVLLSAMKGGDLRVYGNVGSVNDCRAFFGTLVVYKKANKLDMDDGRTATKRLLELVGEIPGAAV